MLSTASRLVQFASCEQGFTQSTSHPCSRRQTASLQHVLQQALFVSFPVGSTSSSWNPTRSISADAYQNHFTLQAYCCAPAPARQHAVCSLAISPPIVSLAQRYSCYRNVKLSGVMDELRAKNGRRGSTAFSSNTCRLVCVR